jgi:hypothetical protein
MVTACKGIHHLPGEIAGRCPVAIVEGRLAAAGLGRDDHLAARILKKLHGGKADARAHQVDKAGHKKADARLGH